MAEKVILTDKDNKSYMPITRGELVLDSSGNQAFKSDSFLATTDHHGLLSANDKAVIDSLNDTLDELERKAGYAYDFINATISDLDDNNTTIDRLKEIFDLLDGISETDTLKSLVEKNLGENYLPLSGGTISNSAYGPLTIERTSTDTAAIKFKNTRGILGSIGMDSINGDLLIYNSNATQHRTILDSNNSSVSKSGNTLTVTLGGVTENLTIPDSQDTWRDITDSVSTTSSDISASASAVKTAYDKAVSAYNLANGKTSNTGTVTKISTGVGLSGGDITTTGTIKCNLNSETSLGTLGTTTALYAVGVDNQGKLCVNVPLEITNKAATLSWNTTTTIATVGGNDITVKLPVNPNTDINVTQTVTSSDATYPLLLAPSGQTSTTTTTAYFDSGVTLNPSTNTINANISGRAGSVAWGDVTGRPIFSTVATTGSYNDLRDKPSIPSIPTVTDYYWANVNISNASDDTTSPTFALLTVKNSSKYVTILPENASYAHYRTDATQGHYFNKRISVEGHIDPMPNIWATCGTENARWSRIYGKEGDFSGRITSSYTTGSPFSVESTYVNTNLNADMVDGYNISVVSSLPSTKTDNTIYILI